MFLFLNVDRDLCAVFRWQNRRSQSKKDVQEFQIKETEEVILLLVTYITIIITVILLYTTMCI